jgi:aspartyl protease family protein
MVMRTRHIISLLAFLAAPAFALEVTVVGLFPGKAVVQINGGAARTLTIGQKTAEGVTLVAVDREAATVDIEGRRRTLKLGQQHVSASAGTSPAVTLNADTRGHFVVEGQINGGAVRFIVDTGATLVSLSSADAQRLGIDYRRGVASFMGTASGVVAAWQVKLDTVRVGDITLNNVDAAVIDNPAMPALLGMSFLNRMDMRREGQMLTLTKRF